MGRYHPARPGAGSGAPRPGPPQRAGPRAVPGRRREVAAAAGGSEVPASRRPQAAPPPSPGRHMVRSAARTGRRVSLRARPGSAASRELCLRRGRGPGLACGSRVLTRSRRARPVRTLSEGTAEPLQLSPERENRGNSKVFCPAGGLPGQRHVRGTHCARVSLRSN